MGKKYFLDLTLFPEIEPVPHKHLALKVIGGVILAIAVIGTILFVLAVTGEGLVPVSRP